MNFPAREKTTSTPELTLDQKTRTVFIRGESYPENSFEFFAPLIQWIKDEVSGDLPLKLSLQISYMNSSSTKCILDILDLLDEAHGEGRITSVVWLYDLENPRSLELAEEFKEELGLPFEMTPLEE